MVCTTKKQLHRDGNQAITTVVQETLEGCLLVDMVVKTLKMVLGSGNEKHLEAFSVMQLGDV